MNETYLLQTFNPMAAVDSVKIPRARDGGSEDKSKFAFVKFHSREDASRVVYKLEDQPLVTAEGHQLNVEHALYGLDSIGQRGRSIYCGNLDVNLKDSELMEPFARRFGSVVAARVCRESQPTPGFKGLGRRFGFVHFLDVAEAELALGQMQGVLVGTKPIRVGPSSRDLLNWRISTERSSEYANESRTAQPTPTVLNHSTLVFCGFPPDATETYIKHFFMPFGHLVRVTVHHGAGTAEFRTLSGAEAALAYLSSHTSVIARLMNGMSSATLAENGDFVTNQSSSQAQIEMLVSLQMQKVMQEGCSADDLRASQQSGHHEGGLEHFMFLLQDPWFVKIFEDVLSKSSPKHGETGIPQPRLPLSLQDFPERFGKTANVSEMNEECLSLDWQRECLPGCSHAAARHALLCLREILLASLRTEG
jgi:hypothetical protein